MTTSTPSWDITEAAWAATADQFDPPGPRRWASPGELARQLDPRTRSTPALDLIDAALVKLLDEPDGRLIITIPPQEGKSLRAARDFPTWVLTQRPDTRIVNASHSQNLANRNGRLIRNAINTHPELGLDIAPDNGAVHEWEIAHHEGGVLSVGIGAGLTGRPADLMIIDDPIKDRLEADSEVFRESRWEWWTDVASTRLAPGAPVVVILTRWHEDDLAGRLLDAPDGEIWTVLNIPAQADHDPNVGETDPLDRAPGEYLESVRGRTDRQWEAKKKAVGSRTWQAMYQGKPSAPAGDTLLRSWWQRFETPQHIVRDDGSHVVTHFDEIIQSWDMAFKDLATSDWVVGQVWMRRGADAYLLDQVRRRMDFVETCTALKALSAKWPQATLKLIEDKANGPAVIASLNRKVPGMVPEEPEGGKEARAAAVSPLIEAGNVYLPDEALAPWVGDFVEEAAGFPHGVNDDQVDAMSQALNRLVLQPLIAGELFDEDDLDPELAGFGISPY